MEVKDFIEKAIAGGWEETEAYSHYDTDGYKYEHPEVVLLDPLAWRAVGRVSRWAPVEIESLPPVSVMLSDVRNPRVVGLQRLEEGWRYRMHRMIDALAEGKSIEEFLATL